MVLTILRLSVVMACLGALPFAQAAPKDKESVKTIKKLQLMVHEITTERDRLQADNAKMLTELDAAKAEAAKQKEAATALEQSLNNALTAQKASTDEAHKRLDATMAKLHEVIDKYNALNKAKNALATDYAGLQNTQQVTKNELNACEAKNVNMYQGAQQVMKSLDACQNRGVIDTLTGSEPFTQIGNVEFELLMQEYEEGVQEA